MLRQKCTPKPHILSLTEPTDIIWSSSAAGIAAISSTGVITAAGEGMVTITASVTIDGA